MQRLDINKNGINGWYCTSHNLYNDILRIECQYCNELRDDVLVDVAAKVRIRRGTMIEPQFDESESNDIQDVKETQQELYAKFFTRWNNQELAKASTEAILAVQDMTDEQRIKWIQDMSDIALKAKVMHSAASEYQRQQRAKQLKSGKPWLVPADAATEPDMSVVKTRKERMSKLDKIQAGLLGLMDADDVAALMAKTKSVPDSKLRVMKAPEPTVPAKLETTSANSDEPFDFSKLKG